MNDDLVAGVADYVSNSFIKDSPAYLTYHNLMHTETVVRHCQEISHFYGIDMNDRMVLEVAAWFHDIGHLYTSPVNHEEKSAECMEDFLRAACPTSLVSEIKKIILATKYPTSPKSFLEEIICDADTFHFGTPDFFETDKRVKTEIELREDVHFREWETHALNLLNNHQFYTSYCKEILDKGKHENILILQSKIRK